MMVVESATTNWTIKAAMDPFEGMRLVSLQADQMTDNRSPSVSGSAEAITGITGIAAQDGAFRAQAH
jgi:hypothetical protein